MSTNLVDRNIETVVNLQMIDIPRTLVLVPDLKIPGGVSNYYKTLKLDTCSNISYLTINKEKSQSVPASVLRLLKVYIKFIFRVVRERYEVVVINPSLDEGKSYHRDMVFILLTHLLNRRSTVFFRGWFDPYEERIKQSKFRTFLFQISYSRVNKYIVLGEIFRKKLIGLGVPSNTDFSIETTIADSSSLDGFNLQNKYLSFESEVKFLFLSRIEKEKGIFIAIDAFAKFSANSPKRKCSLIIAGDGRDLPWVKTYVKNEEISNIVFLGHVSKETKKKVLLESNIMIFPSFTEGLPNVILEGMLYGMPIISRAVGGIPEVVKQNSNGYLTESYDPSIFTEFMALIANDISLYKSIAEKNHLTAMENFRSEIVRDRIIQIYKAS